MSDDDIIHVRKGLTSRRLDISAWQKTEWQLAGPNGDRKRIITSPAGEEYYDFISAKDGKHDLGKKIKIEKTMSKVKEQLGALVNSATNWKEVAESIIKKIPIYYDKNLLWWIWNNERNCWEITDEVDICNIVDEATGRNTLKGNIKSQIVEAFKRVGRKQKPMEVPRTWVQFKDVVMDISTGEDMKPTPEYFLTNPIPHKIGTSTKTPKLDALFEQWAGEYAQTLKEILAYTMLRDYPLHRIFLLIGSGSNGKGTYLRLMNKLLGEENVASTEMDLLINNQFHITKLHKRLACQMSETNFSALKNTSMLKRLSGGDLIGFEYKNKLPFDDYNYAKIIIATNSLPVTHDKTDGFYRRWVIIDFKNQYGEKRDVLAEIPEEEYENLCLWCVQRLGRLLIDREFYKEGDIRERKERYEARSNPLRTFMDAHYEKSFDGFVVASDFYDHISNYLQANGHRVLTYQAVRNMMKEEGFEYERHPPYPSANAVACVMGLKRKSDALSGLSGLSAVSSQPLHMSNQPESARNPDNADNQKQEFANLLKSTQAFLMEKNSGQGVTIEYLQRHMPEVTDDLLEYWVQMGELCEVQPGWVRAL